LLSAESTRVELQ